jgi:hypothetical protein
VKKTIIICFLLFLICQTSFAFYGRRDKPIEEENLQKHWLQFMDASTGKTTKPITEEDLLEMNNWELVRLASLIELLEFFDEKNLGSGELRNSTMKKLLPKRFQNEKE